MLAIEENTTIYSVLAFSMRDDSIRALVNLLYKQWREEGALCANAKSALQLLIQRLIASIDAQLTKTVNQILHHPQFQRLEASWRSLNFLVSQTVGYNQLIIRILNINWNTVVRDLEHALEFDQSQLFTKIYTEEFGHPGGQPFGLLIGDYYLKHTPRDLAALKAIAKIAAAAFAPFVTSIDPAFLELEDYSQLNRLFNLAQLFYQHNYQNWRRLREDEDARFVGLVLPRVLLRLPYRHKGSRIDQFCFTETLVTRQDYLWGNASFCFGAVVMRAFQQTGWLADIRGIQAHSLAGGAVTGLERDYFETDGNAHARKILVEVQITENFEKQLSDAGFISLVECQYTDLAVFYNCQSIQQAKYYKSQGIKLNATLATMFHYILCVSRFAHYLKIIFRNKVGSIITAEACEQTLQQWVAKYTAAGEDLSDDLRAKYPLKQARVKIMPKSGQPGSYIGIFHLQPHYQIERLNSELRLVTELSGGTLL